MQSYTDTTATILTKTLQINADEAWTQISNDVGNAFTIALTRIGVVGYISVIETVKQYTHLDTYNECFGCSLFYDEYV